MSLGAPGETFDVPQDPEERRKYLMRVGEITTRKHNERRTFSPEKDQQRREEIEARNQELAQGSVAEHEPTQGEK